MFRPTVLRVRPLTRGALIGTDSHQLRKHTSAHIDELRTPLNKIVLGSGDIEADANAIIERFPLASAATTIVASEIILSANSEYFDTISADWREGKISSQMQLWIDRNLAWLQKKYGEGVASVSLHLDEGAPHLHVVLVPVTTYDIRYRRGVKEVTKINYRRLFSDTTQDLIAAQEANRSDTDTKLGRLQTEYVKALGNLGLVRGLRNSKATHEEIRVFQRRLKVPAAEKIRYELKFDRTEKGILVKLPDLPGLMSRTEAKIKEVMLESARAAVLAVEKTNHETINKLQAKAKDYDRIKQEIERMKVVIRNSEERVEHMGQLIANQTTELASSKDEIKKLRALDLGRVGMALHYDGPLDGHSNAISLLKDVGGLEFDPAIAWINSEFGEDAAQAAGSAYGRDLAAASIRKKIAVPLTRQQIATQERVAEQLDALGAKEYRLTMMSEPQLTVHLDRGEAPKEGEKLYTVAEVLAIVPQIEKKNRRGKFNVFVTPVDETKHFVFVDELTTDSLETMRAKGFKPNLVIEGSKNKMQAVFVVDRMAVAKEVVKAVFKGLNAQFGNKNIHGYMHPLRLAGFANIDDTLRETASTPYPFVRVIAQSKGNCSKIETVARVIERDTVKPHCSEEAAVKEVRAFLANKGSLEILTRGSDPSAPAVLLQIAKWHYRFCEWRWGLEMSEPIADLMFIKKAIADGYSESETASTLIVRSPQLAERYQITALTAPPGSTATAKVVSAPNGSNKQGRLRNAP